jgi:hypothetical protein
MALGDGPSGVSFDESFTTYAVPGSELVPGT